MTLQIFPFDSRAWNVLGLPHLSTFMTSVRTGGGIKKEKDSNGKDKGQVKRHRKNSDKALYQWYGILFGNTILTTFQIHCTDVDSARRSPAISLFALLRTLEPHPMQIERIHTSISWSDVLSISLPVCRIQSKCQILFIRSVLFELNW